MARSAPTSTDLILPDAIDVERLVLGSILVQDALGYLAASRLLKPHDFSLDKHKHIFRIMGELHDRQSGIDRITVIEEINKQGLRDTIGGLSYLVSLDEGMPRLMHFDDYCRIVKQKSMYRSIIHVATASADRASAEFGDPQEIAQKVALQMLRLAQYEETEDKGLTSLIEYTDDMTRLEHLMEPGHTKPGLKTGFVKLDDMTGGLRGGEVFILAARPAMGKLQPIDSPVKTPTGWKEIGTLTLGERLGSIDGGESFVTGIFPQGRVPIYKVTFSDGRTTRCGADHLWIVQYRNWQEGRRIIDTKEIARLLTRTRYRSRLSIPRIAGNYGDDVPLPISPWLLGYILGNGCICGNRFSLSIPDRCTVDRIQEEVTRYRCELRHRSRYDWNIVIAGERVGNARNPLKELLETLGLLGDHAFQKFIPREYFETTREVRVELLRGLLDSDGTAETFGAVTFSSTSRQLAKDVQRLVRSIGGISELRPRQTQYTYKHQKKSGRPSFIVSVVLNDPSEAFWLPRKKQRAVRKSNRLPRLRIESVEPDGEQEAVCIAVSHPSQTYITDDFIVTHNTAMALNIAQYVACNQANPKAVAVFSLEMSKESLMQRMICSTARVDHQRFRAGYINPSEREALRNTVVDLVQRPIFIDDTAGTNLGDVYTKLLRLRMDLLHRETDGGEPAELGLVIIDYMQLMQGRGRFENRVQEISSLSRGFKLMSKEFNVPFLVLSQLSRAPEQRPGDHRPMLSDLRESGSIEQDADLVGFIFREEVYRPDKESLKGIAELILAKQRNGPTGRIKLAFLNRYTKFENLAADTGDEDDAPFGGALLPASVSADPLPFAQRHWQDREPGDDDVPF